MKQQFLNLRDLTVEMDCNYEDNNGGFWDQTRSNKNVPFSFGIKEKKEYKNYSMCNRATSPNAGSGTKSVRSCSRL